jgi:hypothetical protein
VLLFFLSCLGLGTLGYALYLVGADIAQSRMEVVRETQRAAQLVALRRRYAVDLAADDPGAHERLGDALREAGYPDAALDAYETSLRLAQTAPQGLTGAGWIAGSGIETKLRVTRLELAQDRDPARFGQTLATRDIVCSRCGNLSAAGARDCPHCSAPLPIDHAFDAIRHDGIRRALIGETGRFTLKLVLLAIALASSFAIADPLLRFTILFAAIITLAVVWLRHIGNPPID